MERINGSSVAVDLYGAGKDGFKDGNKALGILATIVNAEFLNGIQEELLSVIEGVVLVPTSADNTLLRQAIIKMMGRLSGFKSVNATATLLAADLGKHVQIAQATAAGQIITLPALSSFTAGSGGQGFWFTNDSPNSVTIKANASENINPLAVNSFALLPKETVFVMQQANVQWNVFGSISAMNNLGLGYGMTWQDLPSAAVNTNFTNATGKPLFFVAMMTTTVQAHARATITLSGNAQTIDGSGGIATYALSVSGVVQPGATYSVTTNTGTPTLQSFKILKA
jgi:hypothetical protein